LGVDSGSRGSRSDDGGGESWGSCSSSSLSSDRAGLGSFVGGRRGFLLGRSVTESSEAPRLEMLMEGRLRSLKMKEKEGREEGRKGGKGRW